jgi:hypothetical protein
MIGEGPSWSDGEKGRFRSWTIMRPMRCVTRLSLLASDPFRLTHGQFMYIAETKFACKATTVEYLDITV